MLKRVFAETIRAGCAFSEKEADEDKENVKAEDPAGTNHEGDNASHDYTNERDRQERQQQTDKADDEYPNPDAEAEFNETLRTIIDVMQAAGNERKGCHLVHKSQDGGKDIENDSSTRQSTS